MKTKLSTLTVLLLVLVVALVALVACDTLEQDIDGLIIVTFQFNGGVLKTNATDVEENIKHAYEPNSYVVDVSKYKSYQFIYSGYDFVGWYTKDGTESGDWGEAWDFATQRVTQDTTLYAQWKPSILYTYSIYSVVTGEEPTLLGSYEVDQGATFNDNLKVAVNGLEKLNRTFLEVYYSDEECTTLWDSSYTHPGGETSTDIKVYVTSIEGKWNLVDDLTELQNAISVGANIYLRENIDCENSDIYFGDLNGNYNSELCGNGHSLSNITINNHGTSRYPKWSLFGTLGKQASIHDIIFDQVHIDFVDDITSKGYTIAALASGASSGSVIRNVTVKGTYTNSLQSKDVKITPEELAQMLTQAVPESESTVTVEQFSAEFELLENK